MAANLNLPSEWYRILISDTGAVQAIHFASFLTTHLLSIERADWPQLHDMFKARDAKA